MALQKTPPAPAPATASTPVPSSVKPPIGSASAPFWVGLAVSVAWICAVLIVIAKAGSGRVFGGVPLADWAMGVSTAISPVAMVWMVTAYLQRAADIQTVAEPLRRQLTLITGESGAADARIRRFNQAIREQIELLRSAQSMSQDDLEAIMDRVRSHRSELERFESVSTQQVKEVQDVIRRSMMQAEQMMDDKFTMLRVLDGKLQQNGDGVARQVESVRDQVAKMLEDVEHVSSHMAEALDRATRDSKKLSDTSRLQESSLTNAAEIAAETLGGLSSKIDLSVARFLERASSAREEAERLAHALDAQTRALDDFSSTLPARVSEAEAVLRGVADRLYTSEQMAREQAVHLSEKLSLQVDGLQSFMDRFTHRLGEIDSGLDRRHSDLNSLAERIGSTTSSFVSSWEASLNDLNDRTGNSLLRFTVVNDETRRNAESVAAHLNETTGKYEDVVTRMRALSADSNAHMKGMTEEIARSLAQFEALSVASNKAGEEVQERANSALKNLQHVLERVLTAREATQAVGETLVKDIYAAVDQNEKMIARLNETAQVGARAITAATEALSRQEGELVGKARAGEAILLESVQKLQNQAGTASNVLREQTTGLMALLAETQSQLVATDQKLQNFAVQAVAPMQKAVQQIDVNTDQGVRSLTRYSDSLGQQVARLQEFHSRIGGMSEEMGKTTAQSAGAFEQLFERFSIARNTQDESVRQTLAQFADLSDRMQREVAGLDTQAAQAVEALQQAALRVGEQSYHMLENAQSSGAQIKDIAASLQSEAMQIQSILRQQTEEIGADLARAEQKFSTLGDVIRERADAAHTLIERAASYYGDVSENAFAQAEQKFTAMGEVVRDRAESATLLLDRTTAHYNAVSLATAQDLQDRAQRIDQTVSMAHGKVEHLQAALMLQSQQIDAGASKIEAHAVEIAATSGHAVQSLSNLNEKMAVTHEASATYAAQTMGRIDECANAFERQTRGMIEAVDGAVGSVRKASAEFGEQTGKLVDGGLQIDGVLRQLTQATGSLADQAAQIRLGMEQQNTRLLSQLSESVAQMDVTGGKLQQIVSVATQGADQASTRFTDMTETASQRINATTQDLYHVAERTESTLAALGANITQQAASLSIVGEQIGEQQRILAVANESQRAQMIDLFDKLRAAHTQASEVAERSIAHLSNSLNEIYRQMGVVGDRSQEAVGVVRLASIDFNDNAGLLLQNAQAAEQQARTVLSVTSALQDQARNLREALQTESERAGETLSTLLGRLTASGNDVRELGSSTGAVFTGLQRALVEQTGELGTSMQQISDRQRTLTAALDAQREAINGLLNRLTLAQDETAAVAERSAIRLSDSAQQIARHSENMDARAQSALINVQAAATQFGNEAESIETHARQAEEQARAIMATASSVQEQIHDLRVSMQTEGERTNIVMGGLLDKVSAGAAEIRDLSGSTEMALTSLGNTVTQQSASLSLSMQQITDRQRSLNVSLDAQRDVVGGLLNRLILAQDETAETAQRTAARLTDGADQIVKQAESIDTRTQNALLSVQAATVGFAHEAEIIETHARQAEQQARAILDTASGLHGQIHDLRAALQEDGQNIGDSIGGLLGRVSSGSEEIRVAGMIAETTLGSLQRTFGEQAAELSGVMKQIGDRQQVLAGALDQQRDSIGSLINRFVLAQDETAATAERAAARLGDSTQQITQQLEAVGNQAVATLANIDASVSGFVDQASALNVQGQQTEQQMRGLLSVTAGMQDQARHLREAMQVESARVIEQLSSVITQLETTSQQLRTEGGFASQVIDQAAQQFNMATQSGAEMIRKQADLLAQTADQSEARMTNAGEKVRGHLRLVGEIGDQAEQQAQQLANSAEFATTRLVALRDTLAASDKDGRDIVAATSQRIDDVRQSLQGELQRLTALAATAVDQVVDASSGLAMQSDALRSNLASSESALTEAAALVREEASHLPGALHRTVGEIEAATRALKSQAHESDQAMVGTADRFISVTSFARNSMIEELQRISTVTEEAGKVLRHFNKSLADQVVAVQQGASVLSGEQQVLVEKSALSIGALAEASDKLNALRGEAAATAERLTRDFDMLDQRASASGTRLAEAGDIVIKQAEAITEATARAESKLAGVGDIFRDQLERIRTGLQGQIDDINRGLMQITAQLERTGASLRSTAVGAVSDVERVGQRFDQTGGDAIVQIDAGTQKMQQATQEVARILAQFDGQFDAMLARMAAAGQGIKKHEGDAVAQLQNMLTHLSGVAEKLEDTRQMSGDISQHAIEKLDDVVNAVQTHMNNMAAGAQTAAGIMRGINQIYHDQTQALTKGVGDAHGQVLTMNKSIDDMQQRTDRMRLSLKNQGEDLMNSLRQILAQLEMTGDGLSEAVDRTLQQQAADNLKKMG